MARPVRPKYGTEADMPRRPLALVLLAAALASASCRSAGSPPGAGRPAAGVPPASGSARGAATPTALAAEWVDALRSEDFETRSRAGERLIAMGEPALDAIAAAGEGTVTVHGWLRVSSTRPVVDAILEAAPADRLARVHLASPAPVVREAAAVELGRRGGLGGVPFLIERLDDDDVGVRAAASASLRRVTNRFFGYEARAGVGDRRAAAERWRTWWTREGRLEAAGAAKSRG
jgi:hypothetical protein